MKHIIPFDIVKTPINNGQFLIEASAGTGKTYTIANIYLRLLLEKSLHPSEILVVTFTVPATAELRDRLRTNLKTAYSYLTKRESKEGIDENVLGILQTCLKQKSTIETIKLLHKALLDFDEAAIFTIHSFCMRTLAENAFESGSLFDVEMIKDQTELIDEVVEDYWRNLFYNSSSLSGIIKSLGISIDEIKNAAYYIVNNPDISFLPEKHSSIGEKKLCTKINKHVDLIVDYWMKNKHAIMDDFKDAPINSSPRKALLHEISSFSDAVEHNMSYFSTCYEIRNFTEDKLIEGCGKTGAGWTPEGCLKEFTDLCAELNDLFDLFVVSFKYSLYNEFKHSKKLSKKKHQLGLRSYIDLLTEMRDGLCTNGKPDPAHPLAKSLRRQFKAAMIDEFQDTDPIQFEIFTTIFKHPDSVMFMIGDPKQSIYRFRGADIFAYLKAKKNQNEPSKLGSSNLNRKSSSSLGHSASCEYTLATNHRTIEPLVHAVDQWFNNESIPGSFVYDELKYNGVKASADKKYSRIEVDGDCTEQSPFELCCSSAQNKSIAINKTALHTAFKIAELLGFSENSNAIQEPINSLELDRRSSHLSEHNTSSNKSRLAYIIEADSNGTEKSRKPVMPKDIAVLVRKNSEAEIINKALSKVNVSSVIRSTGNVFKTEEALDVLRVLEAIAGKSNSKKLNAVLCGRLIGLASADIYRMTSGDENNEYEYWMELFAAYKTLWEEKGFIRMFYTFLDSEEGIDEASENCFLRKRNVKANVLLNGGGERALTNILHIGELVHKESIRNKLDIDSVVEWLFEKINSEKIGLEPEEYEIRLDTDAEAVQIITIHSSKGLQYPIVFCPYLWTKGISPYSVKELRSYAFHKDGRQYCDLVDPKLHEAEVEKENLAEEVRLMYVAMTRAVYKLYIHYVDIKRGSSKQTAIYYLLNAMVNGESYSNIKGSISSILKNSSLDISQLNLKNGKVNLNFTEDIEYDLKYRQIENQNLERDLSSENFVAERLKDNSNITADWGVMSYSSLVGGSHDSGTGDEQNFGEVDVSKNEDAGGNFDIVPPVAKIGFPINEIIEHPESSFFHFPRKGKFTGSFCHEILEIFKFDSVLSKGWKDDFEFKSTVETKLRSYGLIKGKKGTKDYCQLLDIRYAQVLDMLHKVLLTPIPEVGNDFNISRLNDSELTKEMEFYYPVRQRIDPKKINTSFSKYSFEELRKDKLLSKILDNATINFKKGFKLNSGYMTGSIDLVFTHKGRFYIADWKGSWLGPEYSDYSKEKLLENMSGSGYFLQHNLYALALHNFLKAKIKAYYEDSPKYYNDYFGGVFYFYIRGMDGASSDYGYIFDKPEFEHINKLSEDLCSNA